MNSCKAWPWSWNFPNHSPSTNSCLTKQIKSPPRTGHQDSPISGVQINFQPNLYLPSLTLCYNSVPWPHAFQTSREGLSPPSLSPVKLLPTLQWPFLDITFSHPFPISPLPFAFLALQSRRDLSPVFELFQQVLPFATSLSHSYTSFFFFFLLFTNFIKRGTIFYKKTDFWNKIKVDLSLNSI